jgi:hypothetical protein
VNGRGALLRRAYKILVSFLQVQLLPRAYFYGINLLFTKARKRVLAAPIANAGSTYKVYLM